MGDNVKFGKLVIIIFIYMVQISSHIYIQMLKEFPFIFFVVNFG
jgi:hypothetical protein